MLAKALAIGAVMLSALLSPTLRAETAGQTQVSEQLIKLNIALDAETHNAYVTLFRQRSQHFEPLELRVEPQFDASDQVSGWDIDLHQLGKHRNLLAPVANWHGLQAFMISPADIDGSRSSVYPKRRVIPVYGMPLDCVIEIIGGETTQSAADPSVKVPKSVNLSIQLLPKEATHTGRRD
jgi:hypothetical protein